MRGYLGGTGRRHRPAADRDGTITVTHRVALRRGEDSADIRAEALAGSSTSVANAGDRKY